MKTTLYMAISANGIIATETGDEEFLSHENWKKFCELAREFGNFVVGRKTYEAVEEERIEVIVPREILKEVIEKVKSVHPYEEVAFDIYPLENI